MHRRRSWLQSWRHGAAYGALGLPLTFVALPVYVLLPSHYASRYGLPLATLGMLVLATRALDALASPWIGRLCDRWFARSPLQALDAMLVAAIVLALGLRALFFPVASTRPGLILWCAAALLVTYLALSVLSIAHQAWGARLGGDEGQRSLIVTWREGFALLGALLASITPLVMGMGAATVAFTFLLALGLWALWRAPRPKRLRDIVAPSSMTLPWRHAPFRKLLTVYMINGVAGALPSALLYFFIRDRLQAAGWEPAIVGVYFGAGILSMPLWHAVVLRVGLAHAWLASMVLGLLCLLAATALGAGDVKLFMLLCMGLGLGLGADLALPYALLAGLVRGAGHGGRLEGAYLGWWNGATKLNLALAAGIILPLLGYWGYVPGRPTPEGLRALAWGCLWAPAALKALAAFLLYRGWVREPPNVRAARHAASLNPTTRL